MNLARPCPVCTAAFISRQEGRDQRKTMLPGPQLRASVTTIPCRKRSLAKFPPCANPPRRAPLLRCPASLKGLRCEQQWLPGSPALRLKRRPVFAQRKIVHPGSRWPCPVKGLNFRAMPGGTMNFVRIELPAGFPSRFARRKRSHTACRQRHKWSRKAWYALPRTALHPGGKARTHRPGRLLQALRLQIPILLARHLDAHGVLPPWDGLESSTRPALRSRAQNGASWQTLSSNPPFGTSEATPVFRRQPGTKERQQLAEKTFHSGERRMAARPTRTRAPALERAVSQIHSDERAASSRDGHTTGLSRFRQLKSFPRAP